MSGGSFDTTGLQPVYRLRTLPVPRRLAVGVLGSTTASTLVRLVHGPAGAAHVVFATILVLLCAAGVVLHLFRPPTLAVTAEGVRLRTGLRFEPLVPWTEVADVRAPGRWDEHASIRLPHRGHHRRTTLLGMPAEDAERMAEAFARFAAATR